MSIDWSKLVNQGRAKAIGVSWTEEEAVALSKCNPVEREAMVAELRGVETKEKVLTPEEVKAQKDQEKADKTVATEAKKTKTKADKVIGKAK